MRLRTLAGTISAVLTVILMFHVFVILGASARAWISPVCSERVTSASGRPDLRHFRESGCC
jgi:hypothetical protein